MKIHYTLLLILLILISNTGCRSMLPSETKKTQIHWKSYSEAQSTFDKIIPNQTTLMELKYLGYDPTNTPNMRILTYLDLIKMFLPNDSIRLDDLHVEVKKCIQAKDACKAYELDIEITDKNRFGSVTADIFGFRKNTRTTGWKFRVLILMRDNTVVYKLSSGQPSIDITEKKKNPLGPFQELDGFLGKTVEGATKF